jgi:hypothetical protein
MANSAVAAPQTGKPPASLFEAHFYPIFAGLLAFFSSIGVVYGVLIGVVVGGSLIFAFVTIIVLAIVRIRSKASKASSEVADVELANTPRHGGDTSVFPNTFHIECDRLTPF